MGNPEHRAAIDKAARLIDAADSIVIAAGAGIGVDSGLPDFRGVQGFWKVYPALERAGVDFYSVASPAAFHDTPRLAWGFYAHRLALYRRTAPHRGFALMMRWGSEKARGYRVFTSNVDGQFQRAGVPGERIRECHGSLHHLQCLGPCGEDIWPAGGFRPNVDESTCELVGALPACPRCGGMARPNVLMFDDFDWIAHRSREQAALFEKWLATVSRPVVIEVGAGRDIPSVRRFSRRMIDESEGRLVRINPRESAVSRTEDAALALGALEALEAIGKVLRGES
jgi:NAD-dependent SIR2 family protein deacetylase